MLVVFPGALLGVLAERSGRESLERVIGRALVREAGHTADRMAALVRVEKETLESFVRQDVMREIRFSDLDKRIAQSLVTLRNGSDSRAGYVVVDAAGTVVASTNPEWLRSPPSWANPLVADATTTEVVGDGAIDAGLLFSTPIPDPDLPDRRLGTLFGLSDWSLLTAVSDAVREELVAQGLSAEIAILDDQARLYRPGDSSDGPRTETGVLIALSRGEVAFSDYAVDPRAGLIAGRARFEIGQGSWVLLVVEPLVNALAPAIRLRDRILGTVVVALVVALLVAAYGARRVLRPLDELTTAIRDVAGGDPSGAVVPVRSEDEVGSLAAAFNKMIRDLDQTQRHLVEAEKFALVGELAAGVAHEVRTSLGVLRSASQILGRSNESSVDPTSREMIEMIGAEVVRLSRVVDDLLTLDNRRPMDLQPTSIDVPIRSAVEFVSPQAQEKGVSIEFVEPDDLPIVVCDREAIAQVCVNLLSNAISELNAGQAVEAKVEAAEGNFAAFTICDNGAGIPLELRDRIFDPFVTGRETGVGLGLTFVKRVVHANRGSVMLMNTSGPGACFRVALPLAVKLQ